MASLRSEPIDFGQSWGDIEELILNILSQNYKDVSVDRWQDTIFEVYKVCVAQPDSLVGILYSKLKSLLEGHLCGLRTQISDGSPGLLQNYHQHWLTYKAAAEYFDRLFHYLNSQHLRRIKKPTQTDIGNEAVCHPGLEVRELCLYLWNDHMIYPLQPQLVALLIAEIEKDRQGLSVNQTIINGVIHSLAEVQEYRKDETLSLYKEAFERPFLVSTGEFYRTLADVLRSKLDCSEYMKKVLQMIDLETLRCTKFIHSSSKDKVISEIRARMVADHSLFLHKESELMVSSDCWQDLHAMYKLLKPIEGGLKILIQQVQSRITQVGLEAIKQVANSDNPPKVFVESFIQVYKKHSELIADTFNGDQSFVGALDKACSAIINHRMNPQQPCRSPELLAKYCDGLLRKPSSGTSGASSTSGISAINKNLTETEIDEKLSLSIIVFKYIDDKDIFQKFYSKNMARRLIFSQLASMEAEESMINKLKQVCGYEFTAKLHRMFTDIGVSNELKESFIQELRKNNTQIGISFSIYVLQAGSWPLGQSPVTSFALPEVFSQSVAAFEKYYYSRYTGRVLTWLYHHCTADLKLCYTARRQYQVSMQTFHAAILMLFESTDILTHEEISKSTQLSDDQLNKHLQGLLDAKILLIEGNQDDSKPPNDSTAMTVQAGDFGSDNAGSSQSRSDSQQQFSHLSSQQQQYSLNATTRIKLNLDFVSKRSKFKIAVIQRDNQYQQIREQNESEQTHSSIDEDRKLYIQAAIVRVMKSRKSAKHNQLIQEVIGLTKNHFTPSVPMIKKCVEILIEKQYLERKSSASDEYKYVA